MNRKTRKRIVVGCSAAATGCTGIVSICNFSKGRTALGWLFAVLTAAQLMLTFGSCRSSKKQWVKAK